MLFLLRIKKYELRDYFLLYVNLVQYGFIFVGMRIKIGDYFKGW